MLSEMGKFDEATVELQHALALRPAFSNRLVNVRNHQVPRWHVGMINDAPQNEVLLKG
tara:strand:+ start:263 stop:436 length:174 start_codon:yes stop_codon:yes gene_type:complete